jgi:hypothetical protein
LHRRKISSCVRLVSFQHFFCLDLHYLGTFFCAILRQVTRNQNKNFVSGTAIPPRNGRSRDGLLFPVFDEVMKMRTLDVKEVESVGGALSAEVAVGALGVVAAAGALAVAAPVAAGAVLAGVIGVCAIDIYDTLTS